MPFLLLLLAFHFLPTHNGALPNNFKSIFNGKNLKGWVVPACSSCWTVSNGVLHVRNNPERAGSVLWTKKKYKDFILELDFRFVDGTVDSGIFLRSDHDQLQIGESGSLKRDMTCSPYIPGKGYPVEATGVKNVLKLSDWNTIRLKVEGARYTAWLNGQQVMQYSSETATPKGPIGIQLHPGNEMAIDYRNLKAGKLKKSD